LASFRLLTGYKKNRVVITFPEGKKSEQQVIFSKRRKKERIGTKKERGYFRVNSRSRGRRFLVKKAWGSDSSLEATMIKPKKKKKKVKWGRFPRAEPGKGWGRSGF